MAWVVLSIAGLLGIGWAVGLKYTQGFTKLWPSVGTVAALPGEERGSFHTLAGFVMSYLGRIPAVAEHFEWQGLRFGVVDVDGKRIDKVLVATAANQSAAPGEQG